MDYEEIARQGREKANTERESQDYMARKLAEAWGVKKELADHILSLEKRIQDLEGR